MTIKITTPNGGSDSLDFGCAQTLNVAAVTGTEVSSGEGKLELKTTTGGTSATKATVLANGNVGIGSSNPDQKLHVAHAGRLGLRVEATTTDIAEVLLKNTTETWGIKNEGGNLVIADESTGIMATVLKDSGNVGIGTTAPVTQLHIEGGGTSLPATTGTTPSAGTTLRIRPGNNAILDIGGNSTSGAWLQSYDQTGMQTEYPLLLNPNGGNVGIGTASPAYKLDVSGAVTATPVTNGIARILTTGSNPATGWGGGLLFSQQNSGGSMIDYASITGSRVNQSADNKVDMVFATGDPTGSVAVAERMRISSDGVVSIGSTRKTAKFNVSVQGGSNVQLDNHVVTGTGGMVQIGFLNDNGLVGSIQTSGTATSYVTSSDYRLKENIEYTWNATSRLKKLKPARFNFITDAEKTFDGFLAHEAQEVVPEAVTGVKDEMTDAVLYVKGDKLPKGKKIGDIKEKRKPVMQGIDQAKLVPLLVKTIQELEARIAKLEGNK